MKKFSWKEILIGLIVLAGVAFLLLYKIGDQYMWTDEVYSFEAAENIIEKGNTIFVTGMDYSRASLYHHLLAWSMQIFGINEFGSRIINLPFILGTMVLIYLVLRKRNKLVGLGASILYVTTNFTIALARETRMYSMTTFFLALTAIAIYKGFIDVEKGINIKVRNLKWRVNIPWMIVAVISFYLTYDTQPLTLLLGFGLILFFAFMSVLEKKKENLFVLIALLILATVGIYFRYGTLNPIDVYFALSPEWASGYPPALPYYSFILAINIPWCALSSPITILMIGKDRKKENIYIFSIFFTLLVLLSSMQVQAERYIVPTIPLLITLTSMSLYDFYNYLKEKKSKYLKVFLIVLGLTILIPQSLYLKKELNEIDTYTKYSVSIYKKYKFNNLREYLNENLKEDDYLIADFHSIYTLYSMDFDIDYFILPEDDIHWSWGKYDAYFEIPLMNYEEEFSNFVEQAEVQGKRIFLVLREPRLYDDINETYGVNTEFTSIPELFVIQ